MKQTLFFQGVLTAALLGVLSGCTQTEAPSAQPCGCNSQSHLIGATLFTQYASEYKALCMQAYAVAARELPSLLEGLSQPAVVLDLDETVLDNSPYTAWQILSDQAYSPDTWSQWVALAKAEAVPGVKQFLHMADSMGIALFYISNRDTSHLQATMDNMRALGMPQVAHEHFLLKTNTSDKTERRKAVEGLGYQIAMLIGDNLGDFTGAYDKPASNAERDEALRNDAAHLGKRYIVLPNTLYGTWEGAIYNYNRGISEAERCAIRMDLLLGVEEMQ